LVLSGGGSKGAYQVGAWKALEESGISDKISIISGTSIGAINMVFFDTLRADDIIKGWLNANYLKIFQFNKNKIERIISDFSNSSYDIFAKITNLFSSQGYFSKDGIIGLIKNNMELKKISKSNRKLYAACSDCTNLANEIILLSTLNLKIGDIKYFKLNNVKPSKIERIILASSAIPFVFNKIEIDGRYYYDGGLIDSTPINPVYAEGCSTIIVIILNNKVKIDRNKFPGVNFIILNLKDDNSKILPTTLNFDKSRIKERIDKGYIDMRNALNISKLV
jgi:NTE family protein